ncbi:acyl-ACP--UDP-N-acetylglucosamine O-acyltransferase [Asticcacaulis endophyticus]|uniref:Acyl-[acyl-carrier-protein]--UDP-N-acetylglucosamine O-acyltransferase n=1 Tax=Asticcacaulis endophyticus TaxID=1395890 RepID=A0A918QB03_9CAUL|nr:acyl-ACP--UDP-N-acetylglucosamine O-acyltransferase [Asticcacaulis endophyticus]GGZ37368.1 acyl-[acyl-carrier-protein]--UDP-N-acetylglucosamine O-acyltransferase [Asticcacaulis endophyticus]
MTIHPSAIIHDGAQIGADVKIGPWSVVGPDVILRDGVELISHAVITGHTEIGAGTVVHPFAVLGSHPQHLAHDKSAITRLIVGERNQIREHVTMHTGTVKGGAVTRVGNDCLFMVGSHVAHDCVVGNNVVMANNASLGGHVQVGDFVFLGGLCGVHQFARIGRYSFVGGAAMVTKDVIPYGSVWGNHARLEGLNLVGLKRRGFSRDLILSLRTAYRMMFADEGTLQERLDDVLENFSEVAQIVEIVNFIREDSNRPICLPAE